MTLLTEEREALYENDLVLWAEQQAALLRARRFSDIDLQHIAEEIQDLAGSDRRKVQSYLVVLLTHLLKLQFQPERRTPSWLESIGNARVELELLFEQSPSLARHASDVYDRAYTKARREAARQMQRSERTFPRSSPFALATALDPDFYPGQP